MQPRNQLSANFVFRMLQLTHSKRLSKRPRKGRIPANTVYIPRLTSQWVLETLFPDLISSITIDRQIPFAVLRLAQVQRQGHGTNSARTPDQNAGD
jgi:hypothetical protein